MVLDIIQMDGSTHLIEWPGTYEGGGMATIGPGNICLFCLLSLMLFLAKDISF